MSSDARGSPTTAGHRTRSSAGPLSGTGAARLALAALLDAPTGAWAQANTTTTSSTSSHTSFKDTLQVDRVATFRTRITARMADGRTVFDHGFDLAFDSPEVQAAVAAATAALKDLSGSIAGPLRLAAATSLVRVETATTETPAGEDQKTVTLEETIGPDTTHIGDRDIDGGVEFFVEEGANNFNIHTHTEILRDRLSVRTETYLTTEHYELVGQAR